MKTDIVIRIVNKLLRPIKNRLMLIVGRGILLAINSSDDIQKAQITLLADEVKDKVEVFQHFGFTSRPPKDTECIMVSVGGSREHGVIIGSENREFRIKGLPDGTCALYSKDGKYIKVLNDNIEMNLDKLKIENSSNELVAVLSEWMQEMLTGKNITAIGPQPMTPDTIATLTAVKAKLDTFKV